MKDARDLIALFESTFFKEYNTRLIGGGEEPLYLPKDDSTPYARLIFREDFFRSALHEISHWLIAGASRRELVDFGYWYSPDGRDEQAQSLFEAHEVKPQALEWILSKAADHPFEVSIDNLNGTPCDITPFKSAILREVKRYCEEGLPKRAAAFRQSLFQFYQTDPILKLEDFHL